MVEIGSRRRTYNGFHVDDLDVVGDFLKWQSETGHYSSCTASSGLGMWVGFFEAEDVPAVKQWLEERNNG